MKFYYLVLNDKTWVGFAPSNWSQRLKNKKEQSAKKIQIKNSHYKKILDNNKYIWFETTSNHIFSNIECLIYFKMTFLMYYTEDSTQQL